ncbi:hypothetical protein YC2023_021018 [Brassica napus]
MRLNLLRSNDKTKFGNKSSVNALIRNPKELPSENSKLRIPLSNLFVVVAEALKGAKRRGASKAGRKGAAVAESQNDEVIAESLEASTQEENQEDGVKDEEEDKQVDEVNGASSSSQQNEDVKDEEDKKKNKPARGGGKRKRATKKGIEVKDEKKPQAPRAKKARVSKPQEEPEYFEDERNLEGLWKAAFPVGTEEALEEEDGLLYGKKVFLFGCTEPQLVPFKGANKILHVPAVVAVSCCLNHYQCLVDIVDLWIQNRISFLFVQVESPFPPSDKIGITSVQREVEEIIPMKTMKMNWLPYIPVDKRGRQVDRMDFQIFVLGCTRRRLVNMCCLLLLVSVD